jgi:hypothetical protein
MTLNRHSTEEGLFYKAKEIKPQLHQENPIKDKFYKEIQMKEGVLQVII